MPGCYHELLCGLIGDWMELCVDCLSGRGAHGLSACANPRRGIDAVARHVDLVSGNGVPDGPKRVALAGDGAAQQEGHIPEDLPGRQELAA